jgi:hypothetical protein
MAMLLAKLVTSITTMQKPWTLFFIESTWTISLSPIHVFTIMNIVGSQLHLQTCALKQTVEAAN